MALTVINLAFHPEADWTTAAKLLNQAANLLAVYHDTNPFPEPAPDEGKRAPDAPTAVAAQMPTAFGGLWVNWRAVHSSICSLVFSPTTASSSASGSISGAFLSSLLRFARAASPFYGTLANGAAVKEALEIASTFETDLEAGGASGDTALALLAILQPEASLPHDTLRRWMRLWSHHRPAAQADAVWARIVSQPLSVERNAALLRLRTSELRGDAGEVKIASAACEELANAREVLCTAWLPFLAGRLQWNLKLRVGGSTDAGERLAGSAASLLSSAGLFPGSAELAASASVKAICNLLLELAGASAPASAESWSDAESAPSSIVVDAVSASADDGLPIDAAYEEELSLDAAARSPGGVASTIGRLARAVLRYAHPSNGGPHTQGLATLVSQLCSALKDRAADDAAVVPPSLSAPGAVTGAGRLVLATEDVSSIAACVLPLARRLLYSPNPTAVVVIADAVAMLGLLRPSTVSTFVLAVVEDAVAAADAGVSKRKAASALALLQATLVHVSWPRPYLLAALPRILAALPRFITLAEPTWCFSALAVTFHLSNLLRFGPVEAGQAFWALPGDGESAHAASARVWGLTSAETCAAATQQTSRHPLCSHPRFGEDADDAVLAQAIAVVEGRDADAVLLSETPSFVAEALDAIRRVFESAEAASGPLATASTADMVTLFGSTVLGAAVVPGLMHHGGNLVQLAAFAAVSLVRALPDPMAAEAGATMATWALKSSPLEAGPQVGAAVGACTARSPELFQRVVEALLPPLLVAAGLPASAAAGRVSWGVSSALAGGSIAEETAATAAEDDSRKLTSDAGDLAAWRLGLLLGVISQAGAAVLPYCGAILGAASRLASSNGGGSIVRSRAGAVVAALQQSLAWTYPLPSCLGRRWDTLAHASPFSALPQAPASSSSATVPGSAALPVFHQPSPAELDACASLAQLTMAQPLLRAIRAITSALDGDSRALGAAAAAAATLRAEHDLKLAGSSMQVLGPLLADGSPEEMDSTMRIATTATAGLADTLLGPDARVELLAFAASRGLSPLAGASGAPPSARQVLLCATAALLNRLVDATFPADLDSGAAATGTTGLLPHLQQATVSAVLSVSHALSAARGRKKFGLHIIDAVKSVSGLLDPTHHTTKMLTRALAHASPVVDSAGEPIIADVQFGAVSPLLAETLAEFALVRRDAALVQNCIRSLRLPSQQSRHGDDEDERDQAIGADDAGTAAASSSSSSAASSLWAELPGAGRPSNPLALLAKSGLWGPSRTGPLERPYVALAAHIQALAASPSKAVAAVATSHASVYAELGAAWLHLPLAKQALPFATSFLSTLPTDGKAISDTMRDHALGIANLLATALGAASNRAGARSRPVRFQLATWLASPSPRALVEAVPPGFRVMATESVVSLLESVLRGSQSLPASSGFKVRADEAALQATVSGLCDVVATPAGVDRTWADRVFAVGMLSALLTHGRQPMAAAAEAVAPATVGSWPAFCVSHLTESMVTSASAALFAAAVDGRAALPVRTASISALCNLCNVAAGARLSPAARPASGPPVFGRALRVAAANVLLGSPEAVAGSASIAAAVLKGATGGTAEALTALVASLREDHSEATAGADGVRPDHQQGGHRGARGSEAFWSAGVGNSVQAAASAVRSESMGRQDATNHTVLIACLIDCAAVAVHTGEASLPEASSATPVSFADAVGLAASTALAQAARAADAARSTSKGSELGAEVRRASALVSVELWAAATSSLLRAVDLPKAPESAAEPWLPRIAADAADAASAAASCVSAVGFAPASAHGAALVEALSQQEAAMGWWPVTWAERDWHHAVHFAAAQATLQQATPLLAWLAAQIQREADECLPRAAILSGASTPSPASASAVASGGDAAAMLLPGVANLSRAQRLFATTACWCRALVHSTRSTCTMEEAAAPPVRAAPGIDGASTLGAASDRLASAMWLHQVALRRLAPAAARLALHPSASVRASAGEMLATVAVSGLDASSASAKAGSALAAVHGVLKGMIPETEEEAEVMANLPVSDPRCTLHNGRVCTAGSAVVAAMRSPSMPVALAASLTFAPDVWLRCRAAAGDEEALAKSLSSASAFRHLRTAVVHPEDTALVLEAASGAAEALGADSWEQVREAATLRPGKAGSAASHIARLWIAAYEQDPTAAAAARLSATLMESKQWKLKRTALGEAAATLAHHQLAWPTPALDALQREIRRRMTDDRREIRSAAAAAWSGTLSALPVAARFGVASAWLRASRKPLPPAPRTGDVPDPKAAKTYETASRIKHGLALGAGAVLTSFPYSMPSFVPQMAADIAALAGLPPPIRDAAREAWATFRRTHADTWGQDSMRFTRDQLDAVAALGSSLSMYA